MFHGNAWYIGSVRLRSQISRLVNVASFCYSYVIREQLQWDDTEQWSQTSKSLRYLYNLINHTLYLLVTFCDNSDDMTTTGNYFLHV